LLKSSPCIQAGGGGSEPVHHLASPAHQPGQHHKEHLQPGANNQNDGANLFGISLSQGCFTCTLFTFENI
jgi:hypothetical protein